MSDKPHKFNFKRGMIVFSANYGVGKVLELYPFNVPQPNMGMMQVQFSGKQAYRTWLYDIDNGEAYSVVDSVKPVGFFRLFLHKLGVFYV